MGSTLLHAPDRSRLVELGEDIDALEHYAHIHLSVLVTLDFVQLMPEGLRWDVAEPVVVDEERGYALVRVQPEAIAFLLANAAGLELDDEQRRDVDLIRSFVDEHGAEAVYELSTF